MLDRAVFDPCRRNITESVEGSMKQYATAIGMQPNAQFQQGLIEAFYSCVVAHLCLYFEKPKRISAIRKELLSVDKEAAAAAKCLRRLQAALDDLTPSYRDAIFKHLEMPIRSALKLRYLSNAAYNDARVLAGTNLGAPKMLVLTR